MADSEVQFDAGAFRSTFERMVANMRPALVGALRAEGARLEVEANSYAPTKTGELKSSSFVDAGVTQHGTPAATMGYDLPRAAAIHEGFHGGKQTQTQGRYWLQKSANRAAPGFLKRIGQVVSGVIGG